MQEPPVAQKNDKIPPVLHLLLSPSSRRSTCAGELLLFIFLRSPPLLPHPLISLLLLSLHFTSSSSSSPPSLPPIFSSSSPPPLPPPLCLNLGNVARSLALPSSTLSLSMRILSSAVVFSSQSEHTDGLLFPPLLCWELSITEDSQSCSHNSDSASLWLNMTKHFYS